MPHCKGTSGHRRGQSHRGLGNGAPSISDHPESANWKRFKERINQFYCLTEQRQLLGLHNWEEKQVQYFQRSSAGDFHFLPWASGVAVLHHDAQSHGERRKRTRSLTLSFSFGFLPVLPLTLRYRGQVQQHFPTEHYFRELLPRLWGRGAEFPKQYSVPCIKTMT